MLESEELNQRCMALRAAEALQQHKLARMKFREMERLVGILLDSGEDLPASLQCAVTRQYCHEMLQAGHLDKWKHAFRPFSPNGLDSEVEWALSSPTFSACACQLDLDVPALDHKEFAEAWHEAFFCDHLMHIIVDPDGTAAVERMCCATLDLHNEFSTLRDAMDTTTSSDAVSFTCCVSLLDSVAAVARGFLAVLNPAPGYCNSTPEDVNFVFPTSTRGSGRHMGDLCSKAKTIVVKLREVQHWTAAKDQYKAHMAVESGVRNKFQTLSAQLQKQDALPLDERRALRQEAIAVLRPWQEKLRPGATHDMEAAVLHGIQADWKECVQCRQQWLQQQEPSSNAGAEAASLQLADSLIQDLKALAQLAAGSARSSGGRAATSASAASVASSTQALTQEILEQRLSWARENAQAALRAAAQKQMDIGSVDDPVAALQELQEALKNAASTAPDNSTWADLFALRPVLWKFMASALASAGADATDPAAADAFRHVDLALAVLQAIESLAADKPDPVYNNFSIAAPLKVAGGILAVRKNVLELEKATGPSVQACLLGVVAAHESMVRMDNQYREKVDGDAGATVALMLEAYQRLLSGTVLTMLAERSSAVATELRDTVVTLGDQLSAIHNGNPSSPSEKWDAGLPSKCTLKQVLDHAKGTLHQADGKAIDAATKQLKKVVPPVAARHVCCKGSGPQKGSPRDPA